VAQATCLPVETNIRLPRSLDESSGVAQGVRDPSIYWSHNDGGNDAVVIGVDLEGEEIVEVEIDARNRDWEDLAVAECEYGSCLYLADTGDNNEERTRVSVLRFSEPARDVRRVDPERFDFVYPDGPRDVEAMYVLPGERVYLVTKGRSDPVTLYRYPGALRDEEVTLEEVQTLYPEPANVFGQVTGASSSADGRWVVVRTYRSMEFFRVLDDGRLEPLEGGRVTLRYLREIQGEAVAFADGSRVILTSERARSERATMQLLECELP
jgi:hypothetical protein